MAHEHPHDHAHPHDHPHDHAHPHSHEHTGAVDNPVLDLDVPDVDLSPQQLGRRGFLRRAGILGAGAAAASVLSPDLAAAVTTQRERRTPLRGYQWLAGDHHIHTQYSPDAKYRVIDQAQHANAYGLDWMVITDHGSVAHAKIGVEKVNPDIKAARAAFDDETLVFQGLEWNIPSAEHGTIIVHPGANEVAVLKEFENSFDGAVTGTSPSSPENEQVALRGLDFLATSVTRGRITDAMFFANHPARNGLDSPHEIRGWRDRQPRIALGFEGAPGHQAAALPRPDLYPTVSGRGYYENAPGPNSYPGYPLESYVTYGGFDWMTATVGGLWDSLLAEGKAWWITANSDSHNVYLDDAVRAPGGDTRDYFDANGRYEGPVHGLPDLANGDFWPGYYSRTHVGAERYSYGAVMDGLRAGRVWVDHGSLLNSLDVRIKPAGSTGFAGSPLGSVVAGRRGTRYVLTISIETAKRSNWASFLPALAKVDVVRGAVTGPASDRDTLGTPRTSVVKTWDVTGRTGVLEFSYDLGVLDEGFYVRLRGSDGKRLAAGLNGAAVDAQGPAVDVLGDADPWNDLWFYTNPIWVVPGA